MALANTPNLEDSERDIIFRIFYMKLKSFLPSNVLLGVSLVFSPFANADIADGLTEYWSLDGDYSAAVDPSHEGALVTNGGDGASIGSLTGSGVPEPSSIALLGLGGLALAFRKRR